MPISRIETASLDSALVAPTATALTTASGSAPSYSARAWVNFNGTGTVAIRASGNVTSITDNAVGDYTVNFTNALPDANYVYSVNNNGNYAVAQAYAASLNSSTPGTLVEVAPTVSACRFTTNGSTGAFDPKYVNVSVFR